MFGALFVLIILPWLDTSKVRSAIFRPIYRQFFWILVIDVLALGYLGAMPAEGVACEVKLRSAQPPHAAHVHPLDDGRAVVELVAPAEAVAPGQACVMYVGDRVLGGGWIERSVQETNRSAA